jgi:hypothetical protein
MSYGSRSTNKRFQAPETYKINGAIIQSKLGTTKYYPLVDNDGNITLKSPTITGDALAKTGGSGESLDRTIGTIPKDGVFTPTPGSATSDEVKYFSSAEGQKALKNQAVITIKKAGVDAQTAQQLIFPNTATSQANPAAVVIPTVDTDQQAAADVDGALTRARQENSSFANPQVIKADFRDKYDNLFYPQDLNNQQVKQDRIKFVMGRKGSSKISTDFGRGIQNIKRSETFDISGSVTLPIQPSITDSNTVDWSGATLNAIQAYAAAASMELIGSSDVTDLASQTGTILGKIAKEITSGGAYAAALKTYFAQEAVGAQNLLSRTTGAILNPNFELLFNGPSLRPFAFTFRMSPRDEKEAAQVRKIIRFFKQGMSVKTSESNIFLQSPNIFKIDYITFDADGKQISHPSINRIKTCALLSCDVDYTPDGTYMTYNDSSRTMTSYQLSLRFSELDPIYDKDYQDIDGNSPDSAGIGY